ncbi:hypothetical protein [Ferrimonas futtsuensis]|uniref:hypothetical protein n=1 Tax=Ferrimonas futtsuensis TaxID=364764 RepID=UPI000485846D|nr:hypothetical protein [Ferrimonas futtsuensis]
MEFGSTSLVCDSTQKPIIVANPITRTAYKFHVRTFGDSTDIKVSVSTSSVSSKEQALLEDFYSLDSDFREAINSLSSNKLNTSSILRKPYSATSADAGGCDNHPVSYFKDQRSQSQVHQGLTRALEGQLGDSSWGDYFSETSFTGGGVTILKDGVGIQVSLQHNEVGSFMSQVYGNSLDNILVFEARYNGELNVSGTRHLNVSYKLMQGASFIDGIQVNLLFNGNTVDLSNTLISGCLRDFIDSQAKLNEEGSGSSGGGDGSDSSSGTGAGIIGGGGVCLEVKTANSCATAHGETTCKETNFIVRC